MACTVEPNQGLMLIVKTTGGMKGGPYISVQNSTFFYVVLPHAKVGLFGH